MKNDTMRFIGDRIKVAIAEKNISQYKLAKAVGMSSGYLSEVIANKKEIGIHKLMMISHFLDIDIHWFITGKTVNDQAIENLTEEIVDIKDDQGRLYERQAVYYPKDRLEILMKKIVKLDPTFRKLVEEMIDMYLKKQEKGENK